MCVITDSSFPETEFVASSLPPTPVSRIQKSGDFSRKPSEILEEAVLHGKEDAVLPKKQEEKIKESKEAFVEPFEKKKKNMWDQGD